MCPPFSAVCRRAKFLERCVKLYFSCDRAAPAVKMAKELSVKTEDKSLNDSDDSSSSQNKFSSLPHDQEQSTKTSISMGSFPQGKDSTSSEDLFVAPNDMAGDKAETKITSEQEIIKLVKEDVQAVLSLEGEAIGHLSTPTSSSNEFNFHDIKGPPNPIHPTDFQSSTFLIITDSPILSEGSYSRMPLAPSSSPVLALTSWLGVAVLVKSNLNQLGLLPWNRLCL